MQNNKAMTLAELQKLPDEQLNVMLAELEGWSKAADFNVIASPYFGLMKCPNSLEWKKTPQYTKDLNQTARVEATLNPCRVRRDGTYPDESKKWGEYVQVLLWVCEHDNVSGVGAPPRQRTIALIATKKGVR